MKILFLSQVLPYPLNAGPKVRSYYNIRHLARNNDVVLLTFVRSSDPQDAVEHLESICKKVVTVNMPRSRNKDVSALISSLIKGVPALILRDRVTEMERTLEQLVKSGNFYAVHADQLWMAPYALLAKNIAEKLGQRIHAILDQHNAVFLVPKRMASSTRNPVRKAILARESLVMRNYEKKICRKFDRVVWVTNEDLEAVFPKIDPVEKKQNNTGHTGKTDPDSRLRHVIPICFDASGVPRVKPLPVSQNILFVGGMHWPPNAEGAVWFAGKILPDILTKLPGARFFAVGKQPPKELTQFGAAVAAPGYVDTTDNYWEQARVFVVPLLAGGGMRVKILDAWARGIPVVSTTIGAEGIKCEHGNDILIADSPQDFSEAVVKIITDGNLAQRLSDNGRQNVDLTYNWKVTYKAWDDVYNF